MNHIAHQSTLEELRRLSAASPADRLARDESFWARVAEEFVKPADFTHLEYGFYHPVCRAVLAAEIAALHTGQCRASHYKRTAARADYEAARADLAALAGAAPGEIAITRNATEAMNIIVHGLPLARGDEVIVSDQDYGSVVEAWEQRAHRDGLVVRTVALPLDPKSDDEILDRFAAAITPRTRVFSFTHLIHFTGQLLPIAKLCALARRHGVLTVVDSAHAFAQIASTPPELGCDFLGASLHKWLAAPLGLGLLYVKRDRLAALAPFFGDTRLPADDIRKLEHFGNRPDSAHLGLREAIRWHHAFGGTAAKQARLNFLQRLWTEPARLLPRVRVVTPRDPARHGALGLFQIEGRSPRGVVDQLMDEHKIFVTSFETPAVQGVRVTPSIATSLLEIDRFVAALAAIARSAA